MYIAAVKFRVQDTDAEALVHEAMTSLLTTRAAIVNVGAWLVAAVCNASRHYWRCHAPLEAVPRDLEEILYSRELVSNRERLDREVIMRQALSRLRPQERRILYLHYFEQLTVTELARALGTTPAYAGKLVWKALRRMRRLFMGVEPGRRGGRPARASISGIELRAEAVVDPVQAVGHQDEAREIESMALPGVAVHASDECSARVLQFARALG